MITSSRCRCTQHAISRVVVLVLILAAATFSPGETATAQLGPRQPSLLADINQGVQPLDASPTHLTVVGDRVFFFARDHLHGWGLWSTDGTAGGTSFISNLGKRYKGWEVSATGAIGSSLIFVFNDGMHGAELWRSDGTSEGTAIVRDLNPGPESAIAVGAIERGIITTDQQAFFIAQDGLDRWGLWSSDGTADGTVLLHEISTPIGGSGFPRVDMIAVGDLIYFEGSDAAHGLELWVSNGTPAGTRLVRDINPGLTAGNPYAFGAIGKTLLLTADDGVHGYELWRSDGTESGTSLVSDINPGPGSSSGWQFTTVGGQGIFLADDGSRGRQLWRSDGTEAGTTMVPRPPDDAAPLPDYTILHAGAGCVFVEAHDPSATRLLASCGGLELRLLHRFGGSPPYAPPKFAFTALGTNTVFSVRENPKEGLWLTDGTAAGTARIAQLANAWSLIPFAEQVLFSAATSQYGQELWVSDGTATGTRIIKDLNAPPAGSAATCMYTRGDQLFFGADDGIHGQELWLSDGTSGGTQLLADLLPGPGSSAPCDFTPFGGTLVFSAANKLWRTDGTAAGTSLIRTADQPDGVTARSGLTVVGDQGFFTSGPKDSDLWVLTDDLSAAQLIYSFQLTGRIGVQPIAPRFALQHHLMFVVWEFYAPQQLWTSDGTPAGTRLIAPDVAALDRLGDRLLFMRIGYGEGALWSSDGTPEGTSQLSEALGQYVWSNSYLSDSAPGRLFFTELLSLGEGWIAVSDGTKNGAHVLRRFLWLVDSLVATSDGAFFVQYEASPQAMDAELWHTDGTSDGTRLVRSFVSANWNVKPRDLIPIGDDVFFAGGDAAHGRELWISDGRPGGTRLCRDLNPGPASSSPRLIGGSAILGSQLIFAADDGVHGEELWSLPLSAPCDMSLYLPLVSSTPRER
jgi:ELWxxDGT repeat protein